MPAYYHKTKKYGHLRINNNLKLKAKENNLTFTELAALIGSAQPVISNFSTGRSFPSLPTAFHIAAVLGCTIEDIWETPF